MDIKGKKKKAEGKSVRQTSTFFPHSGQPETEASLTMLFCFPVLFCFPIEIAQVSSIGIFLHLGWLSFRNKNLFPHPLGGLPAESPPVTASYRDCLDAEICLDQGRTAFPEYLVSNDW